MCFFRCYALSNFADYQMATLSSNKTNVIVDMLG